MSFESAAALTQAPQSTVPRSPSAPHSGCPGARPGGPGSRTMGPLEARPGPGPWLWAVAEAMTEGRLWLAPGLWPEIGPAGRERLRATALGSAWERGYLWS